MPIRPLLEEYLSNYGLSKEKKKRTKRLDKLTDDIESTESQNKTNPSTLLQTVIFSLRHELHSLLLESFEKAYNKVRVNTYTTGNKSGKLMALRIKGHRTNTKIPYIHHLHTNEKLLKAHNIANTFSAYYNDLYNIRGNKTTFQSCQEKISDFLAQVNLSSTSPTQLTSLNTPYTIHKIVQEIKNLPNSKSPGPDGFIGEYYK